MCDHSHPSKQEAHPVHSSSSLSPNQGPSAFNRLKTQSHPLSPYAEIPQKTKGRNLSASTKERSWNPQREVAIHVRQEPDPDPKSCDPFLPPHTASFRTTEVPESRPGTKALSSMHLWCALEAQDLIVSKPEAAASCCILSQKCSKLRSLSVSSLASQSTSHPQALGTAQTDSLRKSNLPLPCFGYCFEISFAVIWVFDAQFQSMVNTDIS